MRPRPVEIVIRMETTATLEELRRHYYAAICDALTVRGSYGKIVRVDVCSVKRLNATGTQGGAA